MKRALAEHLLAGLRPPPARCLFLGAATGVNDALSSNFPELVRRVTMALFPKHDLRLEGSGSFL